MSEEIVFYHNPRSRAQMAHGMLEEVGAPCIARLAADPVARRAAGG
jgi:hypothetical protein